MTELEQAIAKIMCPKCMYGGHSRLPCGYTYQTCQTIPPILALIVKEQQPLIDALREARSTLIDKLRYEAFIWDADNDRANLFANSNPAVKQIDLALAKIGGK